jgi:hypothetical protein
LAFASSIGSTWSAVRAAGVVADVVEDVPHDERRRALVQGEDVGEREQAVVVLDDQAAVSEDLDREAETVHDSDNVRTR